jgi:hypothetical protein
MESRVKVTGELKLHIEATVKESTTEAFWIKVSAGRADSRKWGKPGGVICTAR